MPRREIPVIEPYNPLDKINLGNSVAERLLHGDVHALPPDPFVGAGVYAIYYHGDFPLYRRLSELNNDECKVPIYVGKAVPAGGRRGNLDLSVSPGTVLLNRLSEHHDSVDQAENLNIEDFSCRFLVVDDIWIPLAESLLIRRFRPLWNSVLDGFGNHDPGSGRYNQQKSPWDCVHPGRSWAKHLRPNATDTQQFVERIQQFMENI